MTRSSYACMSCRQPCRSIGDYIRHAGPPCARPRFARVGSWAGGQPMFISPVGPRASAIRDWPSPPEQVPLWELLATHRVVVRPEDWNGD